MPEKTVATTLPGTVQKIIPSPDPSIPEKAEIAVQGADELYKEIRIENTLTDEKGQEVKLKPGAEVEVTVEAPPEAVVPKSSGSKTDPSGTSSSNTSQDKQDRQDKKAQGTANG